MCKKIIFTVLLAYCIGLAAFNVPTANAQAAAAKATPVRLQGGLTLHAPAGWAAQPPAATKVVLVNAANDSLIVGSLDSGEISLAGPELTNGFPMGNGVFLRPTGTPKQVGGVYSNTFVATGTPTKALGVVLIRAANGGRLVTLIGLAPPERMEMVIRAMAPMIASATVSPAAAPRSSGELATYLKGRYLVRFYSGSGYSEKHEMWLCSNGEFRSRFDGGGFTQGVASGAFAGANKGNWSATGGRSGGSLVLSASDGSVSRFNLRESSDGLMLNGNKWMRGTNELCN